MAGNDQWKMATPSDGLLKGKWWEIFGDPQLNRLEELVNINNQNVKQAEAQFRQARALVLANHANYYPDHRIDPVDHAKRHRNERRQSWRHQPDFSLPAAASWEPDLWGRVRLSVENAVRQRAGERGRSRKCPPQRAGAAGHRLLFCWPRRTCSKRVLQRHHRRLPEEPAADHQPLQRRTSHREATLRWRKPSWPAPEPRARILRIARAQYEHAIAVLTGQPPAVARDWRQQDRRARLRPFRWRVPSQLLERRPDIAANERLVAAANANVGIAETAYYPTLTLSASAGFLSTNLANLFTYASRSWSAGPGVSQTLFDFGRRGAAAGRTPQAAYDATVAAYRQTVLSAFQEVEDDLASSALSGRRGGAAAGSRRRRPAGAELWKSTAIRPEPIPT